MTVTLLVAILVSVLAGLVCTAGLWTRQVPTLPVFVLMASLAVGLGFGFSACASFLTLSFFGASRHGLIATDVGLLLLLGIAGFAAFTRRAPRAAADATVAAIPAEAQLAARWLSRHHFGLRAPHLRAPVPEESPRVLGRLGDLEPGNLTPARIGVLGPHDDPIRNVWVNAWERARIGRS